MWHDALNRRVDAFLARLRAEQTPEILPIYNAVEIFGRVMGCPPTDWQLELLTSESSRLLINASRQSGKSHLCACLAMEKALMRPGSLTLLVSPSLRQSSELAKKVWRCYRTLGRPINAESETRLSLELSTGSRVVCLPSQEKTIRGFSSVDLLVIDEAARVDVSLYQATRPMLAASGGRIVASSTPFGVGGWWAAAWRSGSEWTRVQITADRCPWIPTGFLAEERQVLGEEFFAQEYYAAFAASSERAVFDLDDILDCLDDDAKEIFLRGA